MRSSSSSFLNSRRNGASRFGEENRLGIPRPSLDSMRTSRGNQRSQPQSEIETDYDSYYDEEDENEMEAEALLSRKHGEASEAGGSSKVDKKRGASATDQDIADEYAKQEKEKKKKARRKVQRTITPEDLIKPKGLTVVRNGIASRFHGSGCKTKYVNTRKSMAKYSRRLVSAYADWIDNMTGGLSIHETQWKLRALGSKTQVKQYLNDMRKTIRNDHVERLMGLEKAEHLLGQLDNYYDEEQQQQEGYTGDDVDEAIEAMEGGSTNPSTVSSPAIANPYANSDNGSDSNPRKSSASVAVTPTNTSNSGRNDSTDDNENNVDQQEHQRKDDDPLQRRLRLQKEYRARRHVLEDSDDEEEAIFDDVVPSTTPKTGLTVDANEDNSSSPRPSTTKKASRRHVLDDDDSNDESNDDDDDDDDDDDKKTRDNTSEDEKVDARSVESDDGAIATGNTKQQEESNKDEDGFIADSEIAITPSKTDIGKLEEKFESVKALLEGGEKTEETTTEAPTEEGKSDEAVVVDEEDDDHNQDDNSGAVQADDNEEASAREANTVKDKTEDFDNSSKNLEHSTDSTADGL